MSGDTSKENTFNELEVKKNDDKMRAQIEDIAKMNNIELKPHLVDGIIREIGYTCGGEDAIVDLDEIVLSTSNESGLTYTVRYHTDNASYKHSILKYMEDITFQFGYFCSDVYNNYYNKADKEFLDKYGLVEWIKDLMEGVEDVKYRKVLESRLNVYGECYYARSDTDVGMYELDKQFVKNIIEKKGLYSGVLFMVCIDGIDRVKDYLEGNDEVVSEYLSKPNLGGYYTFPIQTIFEQIFDGDSEPSKEMIQDFFEGLANSDLGKEKKDTIGEFIEDSMRYNEALSYIVGEIPTFKAAAEKIAQAPQADEHSTDSLVKEAAARLERDMGPVAGEKPVADEKPIEEDVVETS